MAKTRDDAVMTVSNGIRASVSAMELSKVCSCGVESGSIEEKIGCEVRYYLILIC